MLGTMMPLALGVMGALQATTDTTFAVRGTPRIELRDVRGSVYVEAWDQPQVRIRAEHGSRDRVQVDDRGGVVTIRAVRDQGRPVAVDYRITVPRVVALTLTGTTADFHVTGVRGDIRVESVEGDLVFRDLGSVTATTVEGDITLDGAAGNVRVSSIDGDLIVRRVRGDLIASTIDGEVTLEGIEASNVDVNTVDGDIRYDGVIRDRGQYRFATHDGDVTLLVPSSINATVSVATFDGDFESTFPVQVRPGGHRGHRIGFTIGNGRAQLEIESFDGAIRLLSR
jgi:DUF4097 and DUF4098 domain-containing protein YvlB